MPRPKRSKLDQALPHAEAAVAALRKNGASRQADAVQTVIDTALDYATAAEQLAAGRARQRESAPTKSLVLRCDVALAERARASGDDLSAVIADGMRAFLDGSWKPEQPQRATRHSNPDRTQVSATLDRDLLQDAATDCDALVADEGWSTTRGYMLNTSHLALQWLALKYPAPQRAAK